MADSLLCSQINGCDSDRIAITDRGLLYGHGLFETIRYCDGEAPLLKHHFDRLLVGCQRLGLIVDRDDLLAEFDSFCRRLHTNEYNDAVIKLMVTAGSGSRGYQMSDSIAPSIICQAFFLPSIPEQHYQAGIVARICEYRLPHAPQLAGMKHLNRLDQVLARAEWSDDSIQEGIMLDQLGQVIEATSSNIFINMDGQWITPNLNASGVDGVMRQLLIDELFPALDLDIQVTNCPKNNLNNATELFLCNALLGIRPIRKINNHDYSVGDNTRKLQIELGRRFPCYRV